MFLIIANGIKAREMDQVNYLWSLRKNMLPIDAIIALDGKPKEGEGIYEPECRRKFKLGLDELSNKLFKFAFWGLNKSLNCLDLGKSPFALATFTLHFSQKIAR